MKILIRLVAWTVLSVLIQQGIFFYIENIYLSKEVSIKVEKIEERDEEPKNKLQKVTLKSEVDNLNVSDSGRYIAYMENGNLTILDSYNNEENKLNLRIDGELVYYQWLTNEDNMIIMRKIKSGSRWYFEPVAYNAKKSEIINLTDYDIDKIKIRLNNEDEKVENLIFSTASSTLYVKIKKTNGRCDLYKLNIMNQLELARSNVKIGNIVVPPTTTKCVMEMGNYATVLDSPDNIIIPGVKVTKILGTDINDNVYLGEEVDGKIRKIHYKILNDEKSKWNILNLSKAFKKEDIKINYMGEIFLNDSTEHKVIDISKEISIPYEGSFVQIYSNGVISKLGNDIIKNEFPKKK